MLEQLIGIDLKTLIETAGYLGVTFIVFAESGLFFGFFLPGDSLLFTAGFLASQGFFNVAYLALLCFLAAVAGDSFGYYFGRKIGPAIFNKEESIFFHKKNLVRAQDFYDKYGGKTIILARFMPVVRTFAPILAGVGMMKYRVFFFYNVIGGLLWAVGMTLLGYFLGAVIPSADKYLIPIVILIIIVSVMPGVVTFFKEWRKNKRNKALPIEE